MERDAKMPALKTEEAALLPAIARQSMTGGSALKYALEKARPAAAAFTGTMVPAARSEQAAAAEKNRPGTNCAALRHALNSRRKKTAEPCPFRNVHP